MPHPLYYERVLSAELLHWCAFEDRMTDTTNQQQAKAAGALRARRYRQRRKDGERCIRFRVTQKALDQFVWLGLLKPDARDDPSSIECAFYELANVSLATWEVISLPNRASKGKNGGCTIPTHPELRVALEVLRAAEVPSTSERVIRGARG